MRSTGPNSDTAFSSSGWNVTPGGYKQLSLLASRRPVAITTPDNRWPGGHYRRLRGRRKNHDGVVVDIDLRHERRAALVDRLTEALRMAVPGSDISLRGSLATGEADQFSDIDLLWVVPGDRFLAAIACVREALASVSPVSSVRSDPEFQASSNRRLLFIQLANLPLFWRIDLEVRSRSEYGPERPVPVQVPFCAAEWSAAASAAANAAATIKAVSRGRLSEARGLLERGFDRIGETFDPAESWMEAVVRLAPSSAALDPDVATFGQEVADLAMVLLDGWEPQ